MCLRSLNLHKYRMLHILFFCLSPFFVLHCIHSFSYLSWGVNNIPALFLCSACHTHVQNTNSFLWAQYCACCLLPQVEVVKFPEIIMILHAAILARGLSFFFSPSASQLSQQPPHLSHTLKPGAQDYKKIGNQVQCFDGIHTHVCACVCKSDNTSDAPE